MTYYQARTKEQDQTELTAARGRLVPALGLFFLAPLIGEFLLGNLPITWLWSLPVLALLLPKGHRVYAWWAESPLPWFRFLWFWRTFLKRFRPA